MYYQYGVTENSSKTPAIKGNTRKFFGKKTSKFSSILADEHSVYIPNKVLSVLKKFVKKRDLKKIHKDKEVAIEFCLLFLSNLANTYYIDDQEGWKNLQASKLREQMYNGRDHKVYARVIEVLSDPELTKNGPIIGW